MLSEKVVDCVSDPWPITLWYLLDAHPGDQGIPWVSWEECYWSTSCVASWCCAGWYTLWFWPSHVRSFTFCSW